MPEIYRNLGYSDLALSAIGLGCWQFSEGRGLVGSFWNALPQDTANEIVAASLAGGINWFDTAEVYGNGRSEAALARALTTAGLKDGDTVVATKWWPLLRTARSITATIEKRRARLRPFSIDLYQVHQPFSLSSVDAQMNAMADLVARRLVRTVGVSNFSVERMQAAHAALAGRGISLVSNQMPYSLLDRRIETNGVLAAARKLNVTIIAYSPLAQGLLTGKFHTDPGLIRTRRGPRKWMPAFRRDGLGRSRPVVAALEEIAAALGATPAQVALAWLVQFHSPIVVAIPGASSVRQARENTGALRLELTGPELARLDEVSRPFLTARG